MIEVIHNRSGFFSNIFYVLEKFSEAENQNKQIVIKNFSLDYKPIDVNNSYDLYFNQPYNDFNIKYSKIEQVININNILSLSLILDENLRNYINFLISKYLIIKPHIINKINIIVDNYFKNKKVLGIHIRQREHSYHGESLSLNKYTEVVDK